MVPVLDSTGRRAQAKEERPMTIRESDQLIVLRERESRSQGGRG
jgi:hypothetical protein